MSKKNEVAEKLKKLIIEIAPQFSTDDIGIDTNLINELMFDSIMMMELVVEVEENFEIEIEAEDLLVEKIGTFKGLLRLVCEDERYE